MLKPEYFEGKEERLMELYRQLEDFILNDIAGRLLTAGEMSGTADRLIYKLRMMGESREAIEQKLQELTGLSQKELRAILQDAVLTSWDSDKDTLKTMGINIASPLENPAVIELMNAQYKKSLGELRNLTRTTMNQSQMDLINMLDEADMRVASGVQSYSAAVCDILDRYAGKGIEVLYPTGTKRTLEAAVLCCVRTSMAQMAAKATLEYVKQAGTNLIVTSAHTGARFTDHDEPANHMSWQGRIFYISDADLAKHTKVKDKIEESGVTAGGSKNSGNHPDFIKTTGYGSGEGLCGYNCRHSFGPYDERLGNPWRDKDGNLIDGAGNRIDAEESKQKYRNSQKLRSMERAIRKTKRELLTKQKEIDSVAETDVKSILQEDYDKLAYKLRQQNKAFNEFAEANDLRKQYERIKVSGFKRKQSAKANGAATRYANQNGLSGGENNLYANDKVKGQSGLSSGKEIVDNIVPKHDAPAFLGKIDVSDVGMVSLKLKEYEKLVVSSPIENAIVITKEGNVIQCFGTLDGVYPDVDLGKKLIGAWVTHNHPIGSANEYSFSKLDINLFMEYNLKTLRGIDEKFIYELNRNPQELDAHINILDWDYYSTRHEEVISIAERLGIGYRRYQHE